jgi:hypothetical protein
VPGGNVVKSSFLVGIVCAGTLIGAPFSSAADQADPAKPRPERETVRVAPLAVVPTGTRLENLIRSSEILIVGATNDRQFLSGAYRDRTGDLRLAKKLR